MTPKTDTLILIKAMRRLADDIQSDDGVANAAIAEGAERLAELERENAALREELEYAVKAGAKREADLLIMLGKEAQP